MEGVIISKQDNLQESHVLTGRSHIVELLLFTILTARILGRARTPRGEISPAKTRRHPATLAQVQCNSRNSRPAALFSRTSPYQRANAREQRGAGQNNAQKTHRGTTRRQGGLVENHEEKRDRRCFSRARGGRWEIDFI